MRPHLPVIVMAALVSASACRLFTGSDTPQAAALVRSATGDSLGVLNFYSKDNGVRVAGTLKGLTPGAHGIHIHTVGLCDAPGFTTAGGHFNPTNARHGLSNAQGPHAGDMPNISANASGEAQVDVTSSAASVATLLEGDGSAIVLHASQDDQLTDPAGNSGARVACGVLAPVRSP
jgi:superoxide dismutase, Cu-Zn family